MFYIISVQFVRNILFIKYEQLLIAEISRYNGIPGLRKILRISDSKNCTEEARGVRQHWGITPKTKKNKKKLLAFIKKRIRQSIEVHDVFVCVDTLIESDDWILPLALCEKDADECAQCLTNYLRLFSESVIKSLSVDLIMTVEMRVKRQAIISFTKPIFRS